MKRSRSISQVTFEIKRMRSRHRKKTRSRRRQSPKQFLTVSALEFLKRQRAVEWVYEKQQGMYTRFIKVAFGRSKFVNENEVLLFDANEKLLVSFKVAANGHVTASNRSLFF